MHLPFLRPSDECHRARILDAQASISHFASTLRDAEFGVLFGSFASGNVDSDVDFKILTRGDPTRRERARAAVLADHLNARYGTNAYVQGPEDVPLGVKTIVGARVIEGAISLTAFGNPGPLSVPCLDLTAAFLKSDECQMRTTLSALTTPSVLAFGSEDAFDHLRHRAFRALGRLLGGDAWRDLDPERLVDRAVRAEDGRFGKGYLGYIDKSAHREWLLQSFAAVADRS